LAGARLIFYVSGHGFGHATRICAVIAALRARARSALDIQVRSETPEWIFTERDPALRCTAARVDVGMLQPNGLDLDLPGTLAAHEEFIAGWDAAVAREAGAIADLGASLVVGDSAGAPSSPATARPTARRRRCFACPSTATSLPSTRSSTSRCS
jgi:L-arabinokinase